MNYNFHFQDYIPEKSFNSTSKNILKWIQDNRDVHDWAKDPNVHEMVNLFLFGAKYSYEGSNIDIDTLSQIWNIRSKDFENCNINENNFIYAICQDAYQATISGKRIVNDEDSHDALRSIARIGLYLKQQHRDGNELSYNNPNELINLLECAETLKAFHPDLFEKYAFEKNINVLCKLQLSHELPSTIYDTIKEYQHELLEKKENYSTQSYSINSTKYFCTKLLQDANKVAEFLRKYEIEVNQGIENETEIYHSPAYNYYYSLFFELIHANSDFLNEKFSSENFQNIFNSICNKYNVDFDFLLEALNNIQDLEKSSHNQERQEFVKLLDTKANQYSERKEIKNNEDNDSR